MKLHHDSCADEPGPPIWNPPDCGTGISRPPELSANCDASSSRASVGDSDLTIRSVHGENPAAAVGATLGSWSSPSADLHTSLHAMNRRDDSSLSSRQQPRMIFSSSCAGAEHERGSAIGGGWSPRCYACSFCGREFNSAQALGGHMNIHRRDRARLRTSPSPATAPHQADLSPVLLEDTPPHSAPTNLYHTFEAAFRENPATISSSLHSTYTPPNIISSTSPFRLLEMHRGAPDPAVLALATHSSQEENQVALSCAPFVDLTSLASTRCSLSVTGLSKAQNQAHSLFPSITPHASQLLLMPASEQNTSLKHVEALNKCAKQARLLDCEGAAEPIQMSQSVGSAKRARGVGALDAATAATTARQRGDEELAMEINRNCLHTPHSCQRVAPHKKGLFCNLDLELRLGQSSQSAAAGDCCMGTTAPRPP